MDNKNDTPAGPPGIDDIKKMVQARVDQAADEIAPKKKKVQITSKFLQDCIFANALGDGTLYAALFQDQLVYCKNTQEWFEWTGHFWRRDIMNHSLASVEILARHYLGEYKKLAGRIIDGVGEGDDSNSDKITVLKNQQKSILKRVRQLRDTKRRTACLEFAHTIEKPLAVSGEEFDQKPMLFPCANGVIDLETGKLKSGRPHDYLSLASPIEFKGIDEPAPLWEKTVLEILNGDEEMVAYKQRLFGYAVTGRVDEKVFPVLHGKSGWNGRSLVVETINYVMGSLAGSIPAEMLISSKYVKSAAGPSPDIMSLKGLRMAFASETEEGQRFNASKVKWLTGNDELTGRNPHDKFSTRFQPTHKLFLMTNTQPAAPANDKSFWMRLHLIPFDISFVNRDPQEANERRAILDLDRQLIKEASGILAWLVRGCLLWQRHGLNPPRKVFEATEKYRRNEDLLFDFIDECCLREPGAKEKSSVLYAKFISWYHANVGQKEPSGQWFGKQLSQKYSKNKVLGTITYHGLCLKQEGSF